MKTNPDAAESHSLSSEERAGVRSRGIARQNCSGFERSAFSLVEIMVAVSVAGILFVSLYAALSSGFAVVQLARENLRAGQILQEKMETIRLYTWGQITTSGFIPPSFKDSLYGGTQSTGGLVFAGTVVIVDAPVMEVYSNDLKMVTVEVNWVSAKVPRKREITTYIGRYGLQNYIY